MFITVRGIICKLIGEGKHDRTAIKDAVNALKPDDRDCDRHSKTTIDTLGKEKNQEPMLWEQTDDRYKLTTHGRKWLAKAGYPVPGSKRSVEREPAEVLEPSVAAQTQTRP